MLYENGHFKNNIADLLDKNGLNQADFSRLLGSSHGSVSHWVHGRTKPIRFLMPKVLEILGKNRGKDLKPNEIWPD